MHFAIPVNEAFCPTEVLTYCVVRMQEIWPTAVVLNELGHLLPGVISKQLTARSKLTVLSECSSKDDLISVRLGFERVPYLQITYSEHTIEVHPSPLAVPAAEQFARLPCWARRSARMKAAT